VQPPKKEQKTKEQKAAAAQGASKGKGKKKKWSKGKGHDRKNNLVTYDAAGFEKLLKEIPKSKVLWRISSLYFLLQR
jgi:small subunit ribosomal protein S25e